LQKLINFGVKPNYQPWEISFTRSMNLTALIGGFNVTLTYFLFPFIGITNLQFTLAVMIALIPVVFLAGYFFNYIAAAYCFYIPGAVLMYFMTTKMGIESYIVLFYFPLGISIVHLMGRKETFKHMIILLSAYVICIFAVAYYFSVNASPSLYADNAFKTMRLVMLILGMLTSFSFFAIITFESLRQEKLIKNMLREKEVLLAEVYHRVKNNMSIVTSLLNLKKNNSDSEEAKEALEACRSRVYSMSLVHEKFFSQNSLTGIDFTQYAKELIDAITNSFGGSNEIKVEIEADELYLNITQAIPCGLILNELITNSFKHAKPVNDSLRIRIELRNQNNLAEIKISDNGLGFDPEQKITQASMGLELIHSLCDQLDAKCLYEKKDGSHFSFRFIPKFK
jgi:two-component sensor histidine kinase